MNSKNKLFLELALLFFGALTVGAIYIGQSLPKGHFSLLTPIFNVSAQPIAETVWLPGDDLILGASTSAKLKNPEITAKSAFFIEAKTGEILFRKNEDEKKPIASLTKIMTTIITMENRKLEDILTVSEYASTIEPDKMYLKTGEKLTIKELLEGIFLVSANDASETLAEGVLGDRYKFLERMNQKAKSLGMNNTLFVNPSGLIEDYPTPYYRTNDKPYSTAYDVALMARFAIEKWPELVDISSQAEVFIPESSNHQAFGLTSGINLLTTYPGVLGFKTGFTPEAGLCLVTYAKKDGKEVIGVLLDSTERREDARKLLDYSFQELDLAN